MLTSLFQLKIHNQLRDNIIKVLRCYSLVHDKGFIGGKWVDGKSGNKFKVYNPATGAVINEVADLNIEDAENAVDEAYNAFPQWASKMQIERSGLLRKFATTLQEHASDMAQIITQESGKPLSESLTEVNASVLQLEWFAEQGRRINGEIYDSSIKNRTVLSIKQPIGVVVLVTPWNFPLAMVTRKLSAVLAAGCTCVIKPASDTPLAALAAADIAYRSGIPNGVVNVVPSLHSSEVTNVLCESSRVAGLSFTGSTEVGRILYAQCAPTIKHISLELGGNAPFIVFPSADIDEAVDGGFNSRFRNCGQTCVCANRFILHEDIKDEFIEKIISKMKKINLGNGLEKEVSMGPLINKTHLKRVNDLVIDAVNKGAQVMIGGEPAKEIGDCFYKPTLLADVTCDMNVYSEEIFGPIVSCIPFKNEEEALEISNNTNVGLAGYFYSNNLSQIYRVIKKLECGMIGVNNISVSTIESPFGGVKQSGIGRECSHHGIDEYLNIKAVSLGIFSDS